MKKIVLVAPNSSQYHAPLYRELHDKYGSEFCVFFEKKNPIVSRFNQKGETSIGVDMTAGYDSVDFSEERYPVLRMILMLLKIRPELIVITGYNNPLFFISPIFRVAGSKLMWRGEVYHYLHGAKGVVKFIFLKFYFLFFNKLIISTKRAMSVMDGLAPKEKFSYVPCCVDANFFDSEFLSRKDSLSDLKRALGIEAKFVINATCRISEEKNLLRIIDIMSHLKSRDIELVIVGDGVEKENMVSYAKSLNCTNISFVGFKSQKEICDYYAVSDFCINLSHWDYSPKSMSESMHFGLVPIYNETIGTYAELRSIHKGVLLENSISTKECSEKIIDFIDERYTQNDRGVIVKQAMAYHPKNILKAVIL